MKIEICFDRCIRIYLIIVWDMYLIICDGGDDDMKEIVVYMENEWVEKKCRNVLMKVSMLEDCG